jgi:hypothetical protein
MPLDDIVDVIAVGHRRVTASRRVFVRAVRVHRARVVRGAAVGVLCVDGDAALLAVGRVKVTIVHVVDVVAVLDAAVPAVGPMLVLVRGVRHACV